MYAEFSTVDPDSQHERICAFQVEREWLGLPTGRVPPIAFFRNPLSKKYKKILNLWYHMCLTKDN
jgi:hypothetical protein